MNFETTIDINPQYTLTIEGYTEQFFISDRKSYGIHRRSEPGTVKTEVTVEFAYLTNPNGRRFWLYDKDMGCIFPNKQEFIGEIPTYDLDELEQLAIDNI